MENCGQIVACQWGLDHSWLHAIYYYFLCVMEERMWGAKPRKMTAESFNACLFWRRVELSEEAAQVAMTTSEGEGLACADLVHPVNAVSG